MSNDDALGLTLQLVPSEGEPDAQLLNDLIRLVKQAIVTFPHSMPSVPAMRPADDAERQPLLGLESKIKHHVEQASAASRTLVEQRAVAAQQPDADAELAEESRKKAQQVVAAVQRAIMRGILVKIPDATP
ncbi:hypothetical protein [Limnoglobus roseus]|uniref:Uncharacterized protein n=1 Tax=Limnoglobus roseus TaxID=2598579 RepID=A0A5C1A6W0_9BACT|nr:hypothetical protein [Limnoglobus roseus]QEL13726.1 hypothetical protein PX52LOC_00584 [Limnoglobus roseus]